jgi:hypothetical protein
MSTVERKWPSQHRLGDREAARVELLAERLPVEAVDAFSKGGHAPATRRAAAA